MSFIDYLHEKAEESRHNETVAFLMFIAGAIFYVGGTLITLTLTNEPNWFLFIPYFAESNTGAILALTLIVSGFALLIFGIIAGFHYSHDRGWYMQELHKTNSAEDSALRNKTKNSRRKQKSKL